MRGYLILTLKWAITLVLAYCIYSTTHNPYIPVALIWVMFWHEWGIVQLGVLSYAVEVYMNANIGFIQAVEAYINKGNSE